MDGNRSVTMHKMVSKFSKWRHWKKWVFVKNITTLYWSVEIHDTFLQSHITEYEEQVSTFPFHEAKKLVSFDMKRAQETSPLVLDTICPVCPTWGHSLTRPQRECLGQDWQTLQIQCLHCPLGEYSQNHSPTPVRWSPRRPRSGRWSSACRQASELRAGCPPLSETSPRLEVLG